MNIKNMNSNLKAKEKLGVVLIVIFIILSSLFVSSQPSGVTIVSNITEQPNATPATSITTAGGTFTTLVLNGTFQNPRWKAYVGNISGVLTLDSSSGNTIYEWNLASISGEVYVSRNATITWPNINCTTTSRILSEQNFLSMNSTSADNINRTFNYTVHKEFYVSTEHIQASTCRSTATYINDAKQTINENSLFQEILLTDNYNMIYAALLNDNSVGYDGGNYDFQLIVPEDDTTTTPTTYYFFAELN